MAVTGSILLFVDLPGGELDETGRGLLSYGSRVAAVMDRPWGSVVLNTLSPEQVAEFGRYGVPAITSIAGGEWLPDTPALLGKTVARYAGEAGASMILLPHNDLGSTLAPVIAAKLDAALMTEVATVRQVEGVLRLARPAVGGRVAETRQWDGIRPLVVTVPPRFLSQVLLPTTTARIPVVASWRPGSDAASPTATVTTRIPPDPQTVDLTEAEVIFSAGKGCDPATFDQLKELCRLLNVSFGVTRPVYDLGWTGFERMVGQTGRTVTPRLYVALGISGSMHHVGGIKDSRRIISVNNDAKAPIFPNSDEGFVADLRDVVPRLLERAKALNGGAS